MKAPIPSAASLTALLAGVIPSQAQYIPPPSPEPFAGFINEWLRKDDPYAAAWDIGGSLRLRYEVHDGYAIAGTPGSIDFREHNTDTDNDYLLSRLRLRTGYTATWWNAMVEGRSSMVAGDERYAATKPPAQVQHIGNGPESDTIDLNQAYVTVGNHKEFPLSLKVGRQELSYGEERLIGAVGWNNIGRTFDAGKLRWQHEWFSVDGFVGRVVIPEDGVFNQPNDYDWFSGIYATSGKIPHHSLDLYFLARNTSGQSPAAVPSPQVPLAGARDIYSLGTRLKSKPGEFGPWDYTIEAVGQLGNYLDTRAGAPKERLDQEAYAVVLQAGYTFDDVWAKPRLGLEFSHGSGDSDVNDGKHGTFDNLFPTNHKFYGYGDFLSLQNMYDLRSILQFRPHPRVSVALEGHLFWLADTSDNFYNVGGVARGGTKATDGKGYGINPGYGSFLGSEIDFVTGYAVTRYAQLEAGYSHFFTGSYINESLANPAFGSKDANFFYLQLNVTF